jgi:hypothetical protein
LDVIAQLGWWRDQEHLSGPELYARVRPWVQQISRRQVDRLVGQYRCLLAAAQQPTPARLQAITQAYGGVIVSVDGLEPEGGAEQLWVAREVLSGVILSVTWLPRVTTETLGAWLQPVATQLAQAQCPVLATLSDKEGVLATALAQVWPTAAHQWCQAHYVRQAAAPVQAQDQHLRVQLRHAVRQALGPSLRAMAAQAPSGDFAAQTLSGWGAPAPPPAPARAQSVAESYARLLQLSLADTPHTSDDLAGLRLYQRLTDLHDSLQRCQQAQPHLLLGAWAAVLAAVLPAFATPFAEVQQAHTWCRGLQTILDTAALPTATQPGAGSAAVAAQVQAHLAALPPPATLSPWLADYRAHLGALTERYAPGLYACYDIVGLPRTNNALESLFGQLRRRIRRQTGFKQIRRLLLRYGAWALYVPTAPTVTDLLHQLQQVPPPEYAAIRARWTTRQAQDHLRWRWGHAPQTVLRSLEALWGC